MNEAEALRAALSTFQQDLAAAVAKLDKAISSGDSSLTNATKGQEPPHPTTPWEPSPALAARILEMLDSPASWVNRRVEAINFVGERRVRRRVSVDFELTKEMEADARENTALPWFPVPVAFMRKDILTGFDMRDEQGAALPVLSKDMNASLASSVLITAANTALQKKKKNKNARLSDELETKLRTIANETAEEARPLREKLIRKPPHSGPLGTDLAAIRGSGKEGDLFFRLVDTLTHSFILLVPVPISSDKGTTRRIVKFCYEDEWRPPPKRRPHWLSSIGWKPRGYRIPTPGVGLCSSYHLEIEPPDGLVAWSARLNVTTSISKEQGDRAGSESLPHLHVRDLPSGGATGEAILWLRPPARGLLLAATLGTVVATVLLSLGAIFPCEVQNVEADVAGALLLAVPATISLFIIRPGEHRVASQLLLGVRSITVISALLLYVAAVTVAIDAQGTALMWTWRVLAVAGGLCTITLLVALWASSIQSWKPEKAA